uniref:BTB domain-containing protein n=1 Tax=Knipowitschia caucasica TaxID=637954 RepID=A0AAV2M717_KNICA
MKVENQEFPVHKAMMCQSSKFFRAMFERWAPAEQRVFPLGGLSPHIMSLLLEWIYTASVDLSLDTVQELVMAADMLLLEPLILICFDYMLEHLNVHNCISVWHLADLVLSAQTREVCRRFILKHFDEVMVCEDFQNLTAKELSEFLEDDGLQVEEEITVFQAIVQWVQHDLKSRKGHYNMLLPTIRYSLMPYNVIKNHILNHPLTGVHSLLTVHRNLFLLPLRPRQPESILLAIGGWSEGNATNAIEAYNYKTDCWKNILSQEENPRGSVFVDGFLYCLGGFNRTERFNTMRRLDLATFTWSEMPPMYERRCYVSVTELDGRIYALGGYNGQSRLNTAEVFDLRSNQWSMIAPMNKQRSDASCATLNGVIYICGGFNGTDCLQTAERYSIESNQWTLIAPMSVPRSGVRVVTFADLIYAVGGFDGGQRLRSTEAYDPHSDSWQQLADMKLSRSNFGIEVLNRRIIVVGGYSGVSTTHEAEAYDPTEDSWTQVHHMAIHRSALDCCVVPVFPNINDSIMPPTDTKALPSAQTTDTDPPPAAGSASSSTFTASPQRLRGVDACVRRLHDEDTH